MKFTQPYIFPNVHKSGGTDSRGDRCQVS